ncbi:PAS domain-containing protein [Candidatus Bodocaedibacter vickermanii]|uniref:PAS domain-containing protein n=1 Tax=Candidatus Bodocaedibacter vickermanii TaxID=2741701 RepID=UPI003307397B
MVSRTDSKGLLEYCNRLFLNISGYTEAELLGKPHSIIRHPDMPKAVFKLLWEYIQQGNEIFAYVKNLCKDGAYYWVLAHVTATFNDNNEIIGYHSNRRSPNKDSLEKIATIYANLLEIENSAQSSTEGLKKSYSTLMQVTSTKGEDYNEFILKI